jgi:hypothetical protein
MTNPAGIVSMIGYTSEVQAKEAPLLDNTARLLVSGPKDIASLGAPIIAALWEYKAAKGVGMPADDVPQAIWDLLNPTKATISAAGKEPKAPKNKSKKSEKTLNKELPTNKEGPKSSSPDDAVSTGDKKKETKTMATKTKKAAKKKSAAKTKTAKPANGMPREGTKKAKLLAAAQKSGGITKAEGQKLTGWKEFRGTLGQLADAAKMQVVTHKDPEGKKATRWEVR